MGLGAISVSPLEMASAYATLAAGGIHAQPMAIRKVVLPGGKVDEDAGWGKPKRKRVIPDWVAYEVTRILEQNVQAGTGVGAQIGRPAAGKTGTTDNHADAWFCGFTPQLQTTVWVGYPQAQIPMENVHGISVAGGTFPARHLAAVHDRRDGEQGVPRVAPAPAQPGLEDVRDRPVRGAATSSRLLRRRSPGSRPSRRRRRRLPRRRRPRLLLPSRRLRPRRLRLRLRRRPTPALSRRELTRLAPGLVVLVLVAACVAVAWPDDSPHRPEPGGAMVGDDAWAWAFLVLLALAFAAYLVGLAVLAAPRRRGPGGRRRRGGRAARPARRAAPPLDRRVDVLGVRPHRGRPRRQPVPRHALGLPRRPSYQYAGVKWRDRTSVYAPGFTLASEPLAAAAGTSADAAAWIYKTLAALAAVAMAAARRTARRSARARRGVRRLEPGARGASRGRRAQRRVDRRAPARRRSPVRGARRQWAGAAWVVSASIKWIPLVLFPLRALEARTSGRRVGHLGFALAAVVVFGARDVALRACLARRVRTARRQRARDDELRAPGPARAARRPEGLAIALFGAGVRVRVTRGFCGQRGEGERGSRSPRCSCSRARRTSRRGTSRGRSRSLPSRRTARARCSRSRSRVPAPADDSHLSP